MPVAPGVLPRKEGHHTGSLDSADLNNAAGWQSSGTNDWTHQQPEQQPQQHQQVQAHLQLQLQHHDQQPQYSDVLLLLKPTQHLLAALCMRLPPQAAHPSRILAATSAAASGGSLPASGHVPRSGHVPDGHAHAQRNQGARLLLDALQQQQEQVSDRQPVIAASMQGPDSMLQFRVIADASSAHADVHDIMLESSAAPGPDVDVGKPGSCSVRVSSFTSTAADLLSGL